MIIMEKRKKTLLVLGVSIFMLSIIGLSYAFWVITLRQNDENVVYSDCLKLDFSDENSIHLQNAYPMTDAELNEFFATEKPYHFTITNVCDSTANLAINLETLPVEENPLDDEWIDAILYEGHKAYQFGKTPVLNKNTQDELGNLHYKLIANPINANKLLTDSLLAYNLHTFTLEKGEEKDFSLFLFLDSDTPLVTNDGKKTTNAYWKGKVTINTAFFYFDASNPDATIVFPRTASPTDFDNILTTSTSFHINVQNFEGVSKIPEDITYKIQVIDSEKFALDGGEKGVVTKTISGDEMSTEEIPLMLKIVDLTKPDKNVKIEVQSTEPYQKSIVLEFQVVQLGAIQYIEDLVDMSLGIRGKSKKLEVTDVIGERFQMTRDLDFQDPNSYEDADRTDYENTNMDNLTENLFQELTNTDGAGFLPIGELDHMFTGCFHGGNHTLKNLRIHKSLQINIGFFGTISHGTVKNLTISDSNVYNENQTAGMIVGKLIGGTLEHIIIKGASTVTSVDSSHINQDTYSGGLAGYTSEGSTISYCQNYATVKTQFTGDTDKYSGPAGGITAWMSTSNISHCDNYGEITGQSYVGGIVGFSAMQDNLESENGYGTVSDCTNSGNVKTYVTTESGGKHIGGIVGYNKANGIVENNTNNKEAIISGISYVGGIVGSNATINGVTGTVRNNKNYSNNISTNSSTHGIIGNSTGTTGTDENGNINSPQ